MTSLISKLAGQPADEIYPRSHQVLPEGELALFREGTELWLAVSGGPQSGFAGIRAGEMSLCPLDHENRLALNRLLPWTAPVSLGREEPSFGLGDRLGLAGAAQIRAVAGTRVRPVLAQQSLRELQLTGRTLTEAVDCAAWAVLREGYQLGYACDGDHLKTVEEVRRAVEEGATMITLDCSLVLGRGTRDSPAPEEGRFARDGTHYLSGGETAELGLRYSPALLERLHGIYDGALELVRAVHQQVLAPAGRPIDLEISLDETEETTTPEAHYFVAREMEEGGVRATSVAPKFVGEFQKAIDYIGNLRDLRADMAKHARIADRFGYKLSLHSGSEKFSALPLLAAATGGRCHVKTSGTSWLEAVEVIAKTAPGLYRRMHLRALECVDRARSFYAVDCEISRIPALDTVSDRELPAYLRQSDARQLLHITYGSILERPELKREIYTFLQEHRALYEAELEDLYGRHLAALGAAANHQ